MDKLNVRKIYGEFREFLETVESDEFYSFFIDSVKTSSVTLSVFEKYVERNIDMKWVKKLEDGLFALDAIIRNPTRFIKQDEDIVSIEQARNISVESIRHLSQHTSFISSVSAKDGTVTPQKILNIIKEESFDTYENRFIYTLLKLIAFFLDKRLSLLINKSADTDHFEYQLDGRCSIGLDKMDYHFDVKFDIPYESVDSTDLLLKDVNAMSPLERVDRLRKIIDSYRSSQFYRSLAGCAEVRPPLVMTNVLKKNPQFQKAVEIWDFLNSYTETGCTVDRIEQYKTPTEQDKNEMFAVLMLQYVMMKKQSDKNVVFKDKHKVEETAVNNDATKVVTQLSADELKKAMALGQVVTNSENGGKEGAGFDGANVINVVAPNLIKRTIDELCEKFNMTVDEVHKVYQKEIRKKIRKQESEFAKARGIFDRAIAFEKENNRVKEVARRTKIARELKKRFMLAINEGKKTKNGGEK